MKNRKALVKDTASFAASYNLANSLYRQENFEEAGKALEKVKDAAPANVAAADYFYNLGNVAVQKKDWKSFLFYWDYIGGFFLTALLGLVIFIVRRIGIWY